MASIVFMKIYTLYLFVPFFRY